MYRVFLAAVLPVIIFSSSVSAMTVEGASLCVSDVKKDCACEAPHASVFSSGTAEIFAKVSLDRPEDLSVAFTWYMPDGSAISRPPKEAAYAKKDDRHFVWDSVKAPGLEGWWRVEAEFEGGILSKEFLLTENRQVVMVVTGSKPAKLRAVRFAATSGEDARDVLAPALEDEDPDIRAAAMSAIAGQRGDWAADAVREGLRDMDPQVRLAAIRSAGLLPEFEREYVYLGAIDSMEPAARLASAEGLSVFSDDKAVDALLGALSDTEPDIRLSAINTLSRVGQAGLAPRLETLVTDGDDRVATAALAAALALDDGPEKTLALSASALSEHAVLSRRALDALLSIGGAEALPAFMRHYRDGYRRDDALRAVLAVRSGDALPYIAEAYRLAGGDERLRKTAVEGLADRGDEAAPAIAQAAADPSEAIRVAALRSAATLPDVRVRTGIVAGAVMDPYQPVRRAALEILVDIGTPDSFSAAMELLDDPAIRDEAMEKTLSAPDVPLEMLAARGRMVRDELFRRKIPAALAEAGLGPAVLRQYMADTDPGVRAAALGAVASAGGAEAAYTLLVAGNDPDETVRDAAFAGLSVLPAEDQRGGVSLMFERGGADVESAGFAARALTDPEALRMLVENIPPDDTARLAAALGPLVSGGAGDAGLPALIIGLKAVDAGLSGAAARRLAISGGREAGDALAQAFIGRPELRRPVMEASRGMSVEPAMLGLALEHGDLPLRMGAIGRLQDIPTAEAAGLALTAVSDPDEDVRREAAAVAGRLGAVEPLLAAAGDKSAAVRLAAIGGLYRVSDDRAADALGALALDGDEAVSEAALAGLLGMGSRVPAKTWRGLAGEGARRKARLAALRELMHSAGPDTDAVAAKAASDADPELSDAGLAILESHGRDALPYMHPLLADERLRLRVIGFLGTVADPSSEGPLLDALPSMRAAELSAAMGALGALGGRKSVAAMAGVYRSADEDVRLSVVRALAVLDVPPDEPELAGIIGDALASPVEAIRFYAVRTVAAKRMAGFRDRLSGMLETEASGLVGSEIKAALGRL